jgi:2,3,4,5-tetrahydropyridine-2-carboxylate N-succinyltransferase
VEDNCFVGAGSVITEGTILEEGSVISSGVCISASTPIINRETGETFYGRVPSYSVVVSGTKPAKEGHHGLSLNCAVIVKQVTPETRSKTTINELLRE